MNRFARRLAKLEGPVPLAQCWGDELRGAERIAMRKLSVADRKVVEKVTSIKSQGGRIGLSDEQRAAWGRWEEAFSQALAETRFPGVLAVDDLLL